MTHREKIIATAYTGIMFVDGEHLGDVYKYEEEKLGHGVLDIMHANKQFRDDVRDAVKEDFIHMINDELLQDDNAHYTISKPTALSQEVEEQLNATIEKLIAQEKEKKRLFHPINALTKEELQTLIDEASASTDAYAAIRREEQRDYFRGQRDAYIFILDRIFGVKERVFPLDEENRKKIINSIFDYIKPD